jgi:hypothetical protein
VVLRFAVPSSAGLFAAAVDLVNGRPGSSLRLVRRHAALLVTFLDVLGLPLFLVCVFGFVTAWHRILLKARDADVQVAYRYKRKAAKRWHTLALSVILKRT